MKQVTNMDTATREKIGTLVQKVKSRMRVSSITCSRTVRGRFGDEYLAMSVNMDSSQDENPAGQASSVEGMPLREAIVAAMLVAMQTDISAYRHAIASGLITKEHGDEQIKMIRYNHAVMLEEALGGLRNGE